VAGNVTSFENTKLKGPFFPFADATVICDPNCAEIELVNINWLLDTRPRRGFFIILEPKIAVVILLQNLAPSRRNYYLPKWRKATATLAKERIPRLS